MADDITLNPSSGGQVVATDDSGSGHVQLVKLAYSYEGDRTHVDADITGLRTFVTGTVVTGSAYVVGDNGFPALVSDSSGNWAPLSLDLAGNLKTVVEGYAYVKPDPASGAFPVSDNGGSLTVDGTVATTQSGSWTVTANAGTGTSLVKRSHKPTPYDLISAASTNATSVSTAADTLLYGYYISNTNAAVRYVKFYNKASAPTVGTDTPVLVLAIPGSGAANVSFPAGVNFTTGLAFATTTGAADSDTGAVAANEVIVNLVYATY